MRENTEKWVAEYFKSKAEKSESEERRSAGSSDNAGPSKSAIPELPKDAEKLRKVVKRQRESDSEEDAPSPPTPDLRVGAAAKPKTSDTSAGTIVIPSSGSSSSTCNMEGDSSVIDLTQ